MSEDKLRGELLVAFEKYKESVAKSMIGGGEGKRIPRILEGLSFSDFSAGWHASRAVLVVDFSPCNIQHSSYNNVDCYAIKDLKIILPRQGLKVKP